VKWIEVDLPHALTLAHRSKLYAYDAYLLACAEATRSPLLTLDKALIRAAREIGIQTLEVYS
jgi:predicted nucleic acid-binding protein